MPPPRQLDVPNLAIVIAAAGCGGRFGSDKMFERLGGRTVLETAVSALREAMPTVPMVVVVATEMLETSRALLEAESPSTVVIAGGNRRQDSVRRGVDAALALGVDTVAIHDGARPVIHPDDVRAVVGAIEGADGAILCGSVPDTVKRVSKNGAVRETIDRNQLRLAQTPQVFRVAALEKAWAACDFGRDWSDEAAALEAAGFEVRCVEAKHPNPKVTTIADLEVVRALIGDDS
ncbi:MAG: 2-C-methyl-D-erythritol 4-phosphate cytidylyltransferase [Candidatus Sulfomarinibacteraceae bacterium]